MHCEPQGKAEAVPFVPVSFLKEIHVSPSGSDTAEGTRRSPFATLERAQEELRRFKRNHPEGGALSVRLAGGIYRLRKPLLFTSEDGNPQGVWYRPEEGETAVLSGGFPVTGWRLYDPKKRIYWAPVPEGSCFRQLYVDGKKAARASLGKPKQTESGCFCRRILGARREDGNGREIPEALTDHTEASQAQAAGGTVWIAPEEFNLNWKHLEKIELHILTAWCENILRIRSASLEEGRVAVKVQEPESSMVFNRPHPNLGGYSHKFTRRFVYYMENAYEFLEEENEWYLDEEEGRLYYIPPRGKDPNSMEITAPVLETLLQIRGTVENPVRGLVFSGLSFQHTTWLRPSREGLVGGQAEQYIVGTEFACNNARMESPAGGIQAEYGEAIFFLNDSISQMGGTGIHFSSGVSRCGIVECRIEDISGNGISIGRFTVDSQTDCHVPYCPCEEREICTGDLVAGNRIFHIGTDYEGAVAIAAGYPRDLTVEHNTIAYAPYSGISVGFGWTLEKNAMRNNRILRNEIHHTSQILCDAGAVYTLSAQPGSVLAENYIHDLRLPPWADYETSAIYCDEGTSGYSIRENVLENLRDVVPYNYHLTGDLQIGTGYAEEEGAEKERIRRIKREAGA